jgi:hypothetical protein
MFLAALISLAAIGMTLWLLFTFAIYALPFYAGVSAAFLAYQHDAGWLGAGIVGLVVGASVLGVGQILFATLRPPLARSIVAAVYATPAGLAGYYAVYGVSAVGGMGGAWRVAFAIVGGVVIACVAWARVSALYSGAPGRGGAANAQSASRFVGVVNDG